MLVDYTFAHYDYELKEAVGRTAYKFCITNDLGPCVYSIKVYGRSNTSFFEFYSMRKHTVVQFVGKINGIEISCATSTECYDERGVRSIESALNLRVLVDKLLSRRPLNR